MFEEYKRRLLFDALWDNWVGAKERGLATLCRVARAVEREHYKNATESQTQSGDTMEKKATDYE